MQSVCIEIRWSVHRVKLKLIIMRVVKEPVGHGNLGEIVVIKYESDDEVVVDFPKEETFEFKMENNFSISDVDIDSTGEECGLQHLRLLEEKEGKDMSASSSSSSDILDANDLDYVPCEEEEEEDSEQEKKNSRKPRDNGEVREELVSDMFEGDEDFLHFQSDEEKEITLNYEEGECMEVEDGRQEREDDIQFNNLLAEVRGDGEGNNFEVDEEEEVEEREEDMLQINVEESENTSGDDDDQEDDGAEEAQLRRILNAKKYFWCLFYRLIRTTKAADINETVGRLKTVVRRRIERVQRDRQRRNIFFCTPRRNADCCVMCGKMFYLQRFRRWVRCDGCNEWLCPTCNERTTHCQ